MKEHKEIDFKKYKKHTWLEFYKKWGQRHWYFGLISGFVGSLFVEFGFIGVGLYWFVLSLSWFGLSLISEFFEAQDHIYGD